MKPTKLFERPVFLLLLTGTLIGFVFPLGKIAGDAGVSPILWAFIASFGAALALIIPLIAKGRLQWPNALLARYAFFSGLVFYALSNWLLFAVIPHVGSGFAALMLALSPVFTLAFSVLFRLKAPSFIGMLGIAIGFVGAGIVAISRSISSQPAELAWIMGAIMVPVMLASGNVYRTMAWPSGRTADELAFWSHLVSAMALLGLYLGFVRGDIIGELSRVPQIAVAQGIVAGLTFPFAFRLQQYGGPVLLSQIGYVAAAVGLLAATLFLNESYGVVTWAGAGVIALGIGITIYAQRSVNSLNNRLKLKTRG